MSAPDDSPPATAPPASEKFQESKDIDCLLQWKRLKLTEIEQAIDIAKCFCPVANRYNLYWKKVFALQEQSQALDESIAECWGKSL